MRDNIMGAADQLPITLLAIITEAQEVLSSCFFGGKLTLDAVVYLPTNPALDMAQFVSGLFG